MNKNKGMALAYTVMIMLLVFAICMLITTLIFAQATYSKSYTDSVQERRIYSQIGDIFYSSNGDYTVDEQSSLNSPFALALIDAGFSLDSDWNISSYGINLKASFSMTNGQSYSQRTINLTDGHRIFTVGVQVYDDGSKQISCWQMRSE